jgi:extradiol dioxygenase family protein
MTAAGGIDVGAGRANGASARVGAGATCRILFRERAVSHPFHFAFFVRDLPSTRRFYGEGLGCREGRSTETWVDFDFFGNQISAHTTGVVTPTQNTGHVENILVPMPHFGALLPWEAFEGLAERVRAAELAFVLEPRIRYPGQPGEQATMFLLDPSGNALEFKSFRHPEHVFTG